MAKLRTLMSEAQADVQLKDDLNLRFEVKGLAEK